jgi:hypothetical protein
MALRSDKLTKEQKVALRLLLKTSDPKKVGEELGIGPDAVEGRLRRARKALGVNRSMDAAHILAEDEGSAIYRTVPPPVSYVPDAAGAAPTIAPPDSGALAPFPTKGRPWNMMPGYARAGWMLIGGLALIIALSLVASAADRVGRADRQLFPKGLPDERIYYEKQRKQRPESAGRSHPDEAKDR